MGLDTSHNCWHGAYSRFHRWRERICEVAGYGKLGHYEGFGCDYREDSPGNKPWPDNGDPLLVLLTHSDCDGEIEAKDCAPLADALEALLPSLSKSNQDADGGFVGRTEQFIKGLRAASAAGENVDFH